MKKFKDFLFKQHSPSYKIVFFVSILVGPFIGSLIMSVFLGFSSGIVMLFGYLIGIPIAAILSLIIVAVLHKKKSISVFSVSLISGTIISVIFMIFISSDKRRPSISSEDAVPIFVAFIFGFVVALSCSILYLRFDNREQK